MSNEKTAPGPADVLAAVREGIPLAMPTEYPRATAEQRHVKARFWLSFKDNPLTDIKDVTPALVEELTGKSVQKWCSQDVAFWPWFSSKQSTAIGLEIAAERATELCNFYLDPAVPFNDNARVSLIKLVLEYSGRTPPTRREIKWQDKSVGEMTPDELDAYLKKEMAPKVKK